MPFSIITDQIELNLACLSPWYYLLFWICTQSIQYHTCSFIYIQKYILIFVRYWIPVGCTKHILILSHVVTLYCLCLHLYLIFMHHHQNQGTCQIHSLQSVSLLLADPVVCAFRCSLLTTPPCFSDFLSFIAWHSQYFPLHHHLPLPSLFSGYQPAPASHLSASFYLLTWLCLQHKY